VNIFLELLNVFALIVFIASIVLSILPYFIMVIIEDKYMGGHRDMRLHRVANISQVVFIVITPVSRYLMSVLGKCSFNVNSVSLSLKVAVVALGIAVCVVVMGRLIGLIIKYKVGE
jgi:hypothetical protein